MITAVTSALYYAKTIIDPCTPYGYQKMVMWEEADFFGWTYWETASALLWLWGMFKASEQNRKEFKKECDKNGNACWNWQ
jgi:hypothetical protein